MKNQLKYLEVLLKRLSILFVIYQVLRWIFFRYNKHHFLQVNITDYLTMMWGGFRFDLTALLYLNALFIVLSLIPFHFRQKKNYQKVLFYIFILTNSIGFAFNITDIFYFNYILKRSTVDVFMFAGEKNMGGLFIQFLKDFWWGFILFVSLVLVISKWYKLFAEPQEKTHKGKSYYISGFIILLVSLYFSVMGIRGNFTDTRPLHMNNAGAYINKPIEMAIVLNTPFSIIRTIQKKRFKPVHYYSDEEVQKIFNPEHAYAFDTIMTKKNVMIIIVESLASEYTGLLNKDIKNYKGFTPFLDSLMLQSHTYVNAFANGRKSIDAMPSILTSVPSLVQPYILSPYGSNKLLGLGKILKQKGYKTAFFHGAENGSMGFNAFVKLTGIDEYYGMNEYGNDADYDGHWGIPDDKFLQYMAQTIDTFQQPFLSTVFTLSSHHPYTMPKEFKGRFKGGKLPIHKVIQYADYSLKHFFQTMSKKSWYKNTIFIISADHCNQSYLPEYNSSVGRHAIPIIFFEPENPNEVKLDSTLMQQIDIMPRLLWKLHYSGDFLSFGNLPNQKENPFVVNYSSNIWEYMQDDYLLRFRDNKVLGLYNYKKDRLLNENIKDKHLDLIPPMEKRIKAFIQQYNNRLIENRLTPKK